MKGVNLRRIAVDILNRVDEDGAYAEPLLDAALSAGGLGIPADRGLLTELVYGTLRMRGRLDWVIAALYRGNETALDTAVLNILRTGLYQLQFTDRIPPFAAVNEAVGIARGLVPAAAGLVNAVLRTFLRRGDSITWPDMAKHPAQAIAVLHSHPRWLVERLLADTGVEEAVAICRANNAIPPPALRINTLKTTRDAAIAHARAGRIEAARDALPQISWPIESLYARLEAARVADGMGALVILADAIDILPVLEDHEIVEAVAAGAALGRAIATRDTSDDRDRLFGAVWQRYERAEPAERALILAALAEVELRA